MTDYDIRKLTRRGKGTHVILPGIEESAGGRAAYLRALKAMTKELARTAVQAKDRLDLDSLARLALYLVDKTQTMVNRILSLEAERHTATFISSARRALGIDLRAVVKQEDLAGFLQIAAKRNAKLIKGLSDEIVKRTELAVLDNLISGNSRETLHKTLVDQLGFGESRAKLIAQDQMAKLNSELNEIRHKQAGITEYAWTTSRDERVRPRHRALEGKVYRYGEPTGAEGGLAPGRPIRCRCIAKAIVQF